MKVFLKGTLLLEAALIFSMLLFHEVIAFFRGVEGMGNGV
jgi:hypothetical protein